MSEGPGPFPGVLDLWGTGVKLVEKRVVLLASHGYASLALNYLTPNITKETGKPVGNDYFEVNQMRTERKLFVLHSTLVVTASFNKGL